MATDIQLAIMAGRAYQSTRKEINWFPVTSEWTEKHHEKDDSSGFEAVSFQRGTGANAEIVIAYAGTYPGQLGDLTADGDLAAGLGSIQLNQAIDFSLQVASQARSINR